MNIIKTTRNAYLDIHVFKGVFIPHSETQLLIESIIAYAQDVGIYIDFCSGSGIIGLSLAKKYPHSMVYLIEKSNKAIQNIKYNAERNNIHNIKVYEKLDMIHLNKKQNIFFVSNPPYIGMLEKKYIDLTKYPDIMHQPKSGLYTKDAFGLSFYKIIASFCSKNYIRNIALEHNSLYLSELSNIMGKYGYSFDLFSKKSHSKKISFYQKI